MVSPHIPSIVEHTDIFIAELLQLQGQLRTQVTILSVTIGHDQSLFGKLRQHLVDPLIEFGKGEIKGTLNMAFLVMLRGARIDENGAPGEEPVSCFVEGDQDVLAELQRNSCFGRPVSEEREGVGAGLVHGQAQETGQEPESERLRERGLPRFFGSRLFGGPWNEQGEGKKSTDKKKKPVPEQVPEHVPARRRAYGDGEASTIDVETTGHVEN